MGRNYRVDCIVKPRPLDRVASLLLTAAGAALILLSLLSLADVGRQDLEGRHPALTILDLLPDPPPPPPDPPPQVPPKRIEYRPTARPPLPHAVHHALTTSAPLAGAPTEAPDLTRRLFADLAANPAMGDLGSGPLNRGNGSGTGSGGSGAGSGGGMDSLAIANWVFRPSHDDLRPFNPKKAIDARITGKVFMACRVRLNRHAHDCQVLTEQPANYDLGAAAVSASKIFRIWPPRKNHKPIDDAWVGVTILYDLKN